MPLAYKTFEVANDRYMGARLTREGQAPWKLIAVYPIEGIRMGAVFVAEVPDVSGIIGSIPPDIGGPVASPLPLVGSPAIG